MCESARMRDTKWEYQRKVEINQVQVDVSLLVSYVGTCDTLAVTIVVVAAAMSYQRNPNTNAPPLLLLLLQTLVPETITSKTRKKRRKSCFDDWPAKVSRISSPSNCPIHSPSWVYRLHPLWVVLR